LMLPMKGTLLAAATGALLFHSDSALAPTHHTEGAASDGTLRITTLRILCCYPSPHTHTAETDIKHLHMVVHARAHTLARSRIHTHREREQVILYTRLCLAGVRACARALSLVAFMYVCVCVCVCVCAYICVRESERESEREGERGRVCVWQRGSPHPFVSS